jgi:hypothetical protein
VALEVVAVANLEVDSEMDVEDDVVLVEVQEWHMSPIEEKMPQPLMQDQKTSPRDWVQETIK